jgi:hypothetical protein
MSPSKYGEALDAYSGLMGEAKYRLQAMDTALIGITGLPRGAIVEFGFLQLRLLCELIAVGCLTAHGDLQTGKLKKAYEADKIIKGLERQRPEFYPLGATRTGDLIELRRDGFLTKEELLRLYWRCGMLLHRGSYEALPTRIFSKELVEEVSTWKQKIEDLLSCHAIFMADNRTMTLFVLNNEDGRVEWRTLEGEQISSYLKDNPS